MPRGRRSTQGSEDGPATAITRRMEQTVTDFAEDLGRLLGSAQTKATAWLDQRENVAKELGHIRDTASSLLARLTGVGAPPAKRRPRQSKISPTDAVASSTFAAAGGKRKRTMSPEARAKIAAAQRARWAKQRAKK